MLDEEKRRDLCSIMILCYNQPQILSKLKAVLQNLETIHEIVRCTRKVFCQSTEVTSCKRVS